VHLLTRKVLMFARSPPVLHRVWRHQFANQPDGVQSVLKMLKQKGNLPTNALKRIRTTVRVHVSCTLMLQQMRSNSGRRACEQAHVEGCTDVHGPLSKAQGWSTFWQIKVCSSRACVRVCVFLPCVHRFEIEGNSSRVNSSNCNGKFSYFPTHRCVCVCVCAVQLLLLQISICGLGL
jgi:hypothetical protein